MPKICYKLLNPPVLPEITESEKALIALSDKIDKQGVLAVVFDEDERLHIAGDIKVRTDWAKEIMKDERFKVVWQNGEIIVSARAN